MKFKIWLLEDPIVYFFYLFFYQNESIIQNDQNISMHDT